MLSNFLALLCEGQQLEAAGLLEIYEAGFLHILQDLYDMRIGAINLLCQMRSIDLTFGTPKHHKHHRGLFPEKSIENLLILQYNFIIIVHSPTPYSNSGIEIYRLKCSFI